MLNKRSVLFCVYRIQRPVCLLLLAINSFGEWIEPMLMIHKSIQILINLVVGCIAFVGKATRWWTLIIIAGSFHASKHWKNYSCFYTPFHQMKETLIDLLVCVRRCHLFCMWVVCWWFGSHLLRLISGKKIRLDLPISVWWRQWVCWDSLPWCCKTNHSFIFYTDWFEYVLWAWGFPERT